MGKEGSETSEKGRGREGGERVEQRKRWSRPADWLFPSILVK